jgi:hypothetical protein
VFFLQDEELSHFSQHGNNCHIKAVANGGPKRKPNSVLVSVTLKNDAIGSEKPNANALHLGDHSVPTSQ